MSFVVTGGAVFRAALRTMSEATDAATKQATATGAALIESETKRKLSTYSHPKGTKTPSAPGEPPAVVSGQLRRSIKVVGPRPIGGGTWEAQIGPTAAYGRIQELGGEIWTGATLPPRPYLAPTVNSLIASGRLSEVYIAAWRGAFIGTGVF